MKAFMRNVRQFLATVQEIIVTEGGDVPREHFLDAAVDGQRLHRHLTRLVAAGDNSLSAFSDCIEALSEQLDLIYRIPGEEELAYTTVALNDGHIGRPRLAVRRDQLTFLLDHDFSVTKTCELLGVSRSTIHRRMLQWNLQVQARRLGGGALGARAPSPDPSTEEVRASRQKDSEGCVGTPKYVPDIWLSCLLPGNVE